ncbi:phage tail protein [Desulfovibrio sp. OttesenSCG-928-A18]|nr:phage tail protein [Desulfovibrio sp. OttesenSCG-928-A18]
MVTQLPLAQGGIAPNRLDFNGVLYMLSAFAFWQQSGGMWRWDGALNYAPPCLVFHGEKLWWCRKASGPNSGDGPKTPGTTGADGYWQDFFAAFLDLDGLGGSALPVGSLIFYCGVTVPAGFFFCNGQNFSATDYPKLYAALGNRNKVPDYRGLFLRSTGGAAGAQGVTRASSIGPHAHAIPGPFDAGGLKHDSSVENDVGVERTTLTGTTQSNGTGIGTETAPAHVAEMLCIKHD